MVTWCSLGTFFQPINPLYTVIKSDDVIVQIQYYGTTNKHGKYSQYVFFLEWLFYWKSSPWIFSLFPCLPYFVDVNHVSPFLLINFKDLFSDFSRCPLWVPGNTIFCPRFQDRIGSLHIPIMIIEDDK